MRDLSTWQSLASPAVLNAPFGPQVFQDDPLGQSTATGGGKVGAKKKRSGTDIKPVDE